MAETPLFKSNHERLEYVAKINEANRLKEIEERKPVGGNKDVERSCYNCVYSIEFGKYNITGTDNLLCENPAVNTTGKNIRRDGLRGDRGVCGPDALFYKPTPQMVRKKYAWLLSGLLFIGVLIVGATAAGFILGGCGIIGAFFIAAAVAIFRAE